MKKMIAALLLLVLVGTAGFLWLKPEVLMDAVPSLWTAHHKKVIDERSHELFGHLCRDEIDACVPMADPAEVQRAGTDAVKNRFKVLSAGLKIAQIFSKLNDDDLRIDAIELAPDGKSATASGSIRMGGKWSEAKTYRWVRVGSQWYITG